MSYTITGQRPAVLDPVHIMPIQGDYDPIPKITEALVDPLFEPLNANTSASITNQQNNATLDQDDVLNLVMRTMTGNIDPDAEDIMGSLYDQGLQRYNIANKPLISQVFVTQAAAQHKLPPPQPGVIYTAGSDVRPAARALLAQQNTIDDSLFFASLAHTFTPETLGFWFHTADAYDEFLAWVDQQVQGFLSVLSSDTQRLFQQLQTTSLKDLTESLILRKADDEENEEYSFARVLLHLLFSYQQHQDHQITQGHLPHKTTGTLPLSAPELFLPKTVVFVNVEAHARATPRKITREWQLINASIAAPVKMISNKNLSKLTALPRAMAKAQQAAANAQTNKNAQTGRSGKVTFRKKQPAGIDIIKGVQVRLARMKQVNMSQNPITQVNSSFARANRRRPDDPNIPGKTISKKYFPDIHVYLDCSGSISEDNYQDAVMMLIKFAKSLNVNLYFNSYSHMLSQTVMLKTQNKTVGKIWQQFRAIPKVSGSTDYAQIWQYINQSPQRRRRLSINITDFQWIPRSDSHQHPPNLHYAPISTTDWDTMKHFAQYFARAMQRIDPSIHTKLIGMTN